LGDYSALTTAKQPSPLPELISRRRLDAGLENQTGVREESYWEKGGGGGSKGFLGVFPDVRSWDRGSYVYRL